MRNPQAFWNWFNSVHHKFKRTRNESLLDELQIQLQLYSAGLWFEVGGHPEGKMELIITAEGNPEFFDDVTDLVSRAPLIEGWEFIAFKQAQGFDFQTEYEDIVVNPASSWFLPLESPSNPSALGLRVAVPGYTQELQRQYENAVYIVLDTGLGELKVAETIKYLEIVTPPPAPEDEGYIELDELDDYLAWRARQGL